MTLPDNKPDWRFIQNGATTLFKSRDVLEDTIRPLEKFGYELLRFNCATDETFLADYARNFRWTEQFGYLPDRINLDALNDAVGGEPFDSHDKSLLVFDKFIGFWKRDKKRASGVLDILERASRDYLIYGKRLLIFVKVSDPAFETERLGGARAQWNPKEWFLKDRGL